VGINKNILSSLRDNSSNAIDFLKSKRDLIRKKEGVLKKTEKSIVTSLGENGMSKSQMQTIESLKEDLRACEFNEADIMREKIHMTKLIRDLENILGRPKKSYKSKINAFNLNKEKYSNYNGSLESKFKAIEVENLDKQNLREKIVFNESKISKIDEDYLNFTNQYSTIFSSIQDRLSLKKDKQSQKQSLLDKLMMLKDKQMESKDRLNNHHKESVDLSLKLKDSELDRIEAEEINALFKTNQIELLNIIENEDDVKGSYDESLKKDSELSSALGVLEKQIISLEKDIKSKDVEIETLLVENEWLGEQSDIQSIEIKNLNTKLKSWDGQYLKFEKLVKELSGKFNYTLGEKKLNATGDDESINPLIPLIEELQSINEWVKEQDDLVPVDEVQKVDVYKEHSHTGYLIGGVVLAAAAFMLKK